MELENIVKELNGKTKEAVKQAVDELKAGLITKNEFTDMVKDFVSKVQLEEIQKSLEAQGMKINELVASKNDEPETITKVLSKYADRLKNLQSGEKLRFNLKVNKAISAASFNNSTLAMRLAEIGDYPTLQPQLMGLFQQGTVSPNSNGVIRYFDRDAWTVTAAPTAQLAAKPEANYSWTEQLVKLETIAVWTEIARQSLEDLDFLASEVESLLRLDLSLAVDQQLYSGSGTSPQLKGVYTTAPAFTPTQITTQANIYDLIAAVAVSITDNEDRIYSPNVALVNPVDLLRVRTRKASDGHYVMPAFATPDGRVIDGIQVIPTGRVAANTLLVGDFRFGTVYQMGDITVELGLQGNQFIRNAVTMLAETRLALLIKNINATAFRKVTDITAALNGLNIP
jgi:hypothetical protein